MKSDVGFTEMIHIIKMRWMIERDYQELKQEIGLGHFEGRGWNGFHHHASLCIAAYAFLVFARVSFPPSADARIFFKAPAVPKGFRPRGSASQREACPVAPGDNPPPSHGRSFGTAIPLPLMPPGIQKIGGYI